MSWHEIPDAIIDLLKHYPRPDNVAPKGAGGTARGRSVRTSTGSKVIRGRFLPAEVLNLPRRRRNEILVDRIRFQADCAPQRSPFRTNSNTSKLRNGLESAMLAYASFNGREKIK